MSKKVISIIVMVAMVATLFMGCLPQKAANEETTSETSPATSEDSAATADAKVLKISMGVSDKHPAYKALNEKFKPMVEEQTEGRYVVELYHSAQLGDDVKSTESLRAGTLEMTLTSTAPLAGLVKEVAMFDIPFLFTDEEVADAVLDGPIGQHITDLMPAKGLVNLAWWENGFRHLTNSAHEVSSPEDLKGLKIRTMENKYHLSAWRAMGANPIPMSWSEVFIALEQKAIDGQENPVPNFYASGIHEINPYVTLTGHVYSPLMLLASKQVFDTISVEDQEVIFNAAREAGLLDRELNRKATLENIEAIKEEGGTVTVLTPEQKKVFQDTTAPVWDEIAEIVGSDLLDQLKEEIAKVSK